jgi:hypothetical protein
VIKIKQSVSKYKNQPYTIKSKEDPYYKIRKNHFDIQDDNIVIFILKKTHQKQLLSFNEAQGALVKYLNNKYMKNITL